MLMVSCALQGMAITNKAITVNNLKRFILLKVEKGLRIVCKDVLRGKAVSGKPPFKGLLSADEGRSRHIRVIRSIEDMRGLRDGKK